MDKQNRLSVDKCVKLVDAFKATYPGFKAVPIRCLKLEDMPQNGVADGQLCRIYKGEIQLITDNIESATEANAIIRHQCLGHLLFHSLPKNRRETLYAQTAAAIESDEGVKKIFHDLIEKRGHNPVKIGPRATCELIFATLAEEQIRPSFLKRTMACVKRFAQDALGFDFPLSRNDIEAYLADFEDKVMSENVKLSRDAIDVHYKELKATRNDLLPVIGLGKFLPKLRKFMDKDSCESSHEINHSQTNN